MMALLAAESALRALLVADAGVGPVLGSRIYPDEVPDDMREFPVAVVRWQKADRHTNMSGASDLQAAEISVMLYGLTKLAVDALGLECERVLDGFQGPVVVGDDGVVLDSVLMVGMDKGGIEITRKDGSGDSVRFVEQVYRVAWSRTAP